MDAAYTIVVPDSDLLSRLCGTNDSNLDLIEKYLGVPVFTKGNELSVPDDNPDIVRQFHHIIDRLLDEASSGYDVGPDMLGSILSKDEDSPFLPPHEYAIVVPGAVKKIYPKTKNQINLVKAMRCSDMVFCTGPAGSGKTFLMVAEALRLLLSREKSRIILTRPVVEAGENLGYLPGEEHYLRADENVPNKNGRRVKGICYRRHNTNRLAIQSRFWIGSCHEHFAPYRGNPDGFIRFF